MAGPKPKRPPEEIEATIRITVMRIYMVGPFKRNTEEPLGGDRRHTKEHTIWCAQKWAELFDRAPASTDWNPTLAKRRGQPDRADRFYEFRRQFGCPFTSQVQKLFGSWSAMIRQAEKTMD